MEPIILVGPRGSGKTSIGKIVVANLKLPFVDADLVFKERFGDIGPLL